MVLNDPISDAMSKINNAVNAMYKNVTVKKTKLILPILDVLKENNYVGSYEIIDDGRQGLVKINLLGNINKCAAIKPRYPVAVEHLESFEKRFLPAKDFGVIILSTNKGLLTQKQAKEMNIGGMLVAYCY